MVFIGFHRLKIQVHKKRKIRKVDKILFCQRNVWGVNLKEDLFLFVTCFLSSFYRL